MNEYLALIVLAYCRRNRGTYSLKELKEQLGITYMQLSELLDEMLKKELLCYNDYRLNFTLKGRMKLFNSDLEYFDELDETENQYTDVWPLDKPFYVHNFSNKKWRGSSK